MVVRSRLDDLNFKTTFLKIIQSRSYKNTDCVNASNCRSMPSQFFLEMIFSSWQVVKYVSYWWDFGTAGMLYYHVRLFGTWWMMNNIEPLIGSSFCIYLRFSLWKWQFWGYL